MKFNRKFNMDCINLKRKQRSIEEMIKNNKTNKRTTENVKDILESLAGRYNVAIYQIHKQINN